MPTLVSKPAFDNRNANKHTMFSGVASEACSTRSTSTRPKQVDQPCVDVLMSIESPTLKKRRNASELAYSPTDGTLVPGEHVPSLSEQGSASNYETYFSDAPLISQRKLTGPRGASLPSSLTAQQENTQEVMMSQTGNSHCQGNPSEHPRAMMSQAGLSNTQEKAAKFCVEPFSMMSQLRNFHNQENPIHIHNNGDRAMAVVAMLSPDDPRQFGKLYAHGRVRDDAIDAHSHTEREQQLISQNLKLVQLLNKQSQFYFVNHK